MLFLLAIAGLAVAVVLSRGNGSSKVLHRERAAGVVPELVAFLDQWERHGPFPVMVAPDGGLRTDAAKQARYYASGASNARTLADTPHGRGGAVDLWPEGFQPGLPVDETTYQRFRAIGAAAKASGLVWGGDWITQFPPSADNPWGGDLPHVQVRRWEELPYPPQRPGVA